MVYSFRFVFIRLPTPTLSFSSSLIFSRLTVQFSCFHSVCKFLFSFFPSFFFSRSHSVYSARFSYCSLSVIRFNFIYSFHSHVIHFIILSYVELYAADSLYYNSCFVVVFFVLLHLRSLSLPRFLLLLLILLRLLLILHNKFSLFDSKTWNKNKIRLSK